MQHDKHHNSPVKIVAGENTTENFNDQMETAPVSNNNESIAMNTANSQSSMAPQVGTNETAPSSGVQEAATVSDKESAVKVAGRETKIEWTDKTWNPVTGCTKHSAGCANCYALMMAERLKAMGNAKYANGFKLTLHPEALDEPYTWKKPRKVFVCSMGDLFHKDVPKDFIDKVLKVIEDNPQHTFQMLTKREKNMVAYFKNRVVPSNLWVGVTVENADVKHRIDCLREVPTPKRFLSIEPLLGELGDLDLTGINWIIVGGESGSSARPMVEEWVLNIKEQAAAAGVPFFFKQWGTWGADGIKRNKKKNGKLLQGKIVQNMPKDDVTE